MSPMIYTIYGFAIFFFVFWCGKWLIHVLAISYGKFKLHRKKKSSMVSMKMDNGTTTSSQSEAQQQQNHDQKVQSIHQSVPSISILKPLMGVDPNLHQNLETFFTMNYEPYELLFCIESESDPAIRVVEQLMKEYPTIDARLFIGGSNVGVNPKINNMNPGYEAAKYEYIMISDSGIRMKADTLSDMIEYMTDKVGLVHQMPFTCDREGFPATFEKIFFGTMQSRIYLCADLIGINCHTGMSCLMRKCVLDEVGGLSAFGCYLAEDFFIAKAFIDHGWKMAISSQPALQNSGLCDIPTFQARLTRWAKLRVAMMPTMILLEPLSECMVIGAFASWSVSVLFHWDALVFYLVHILIWLLSDWLMLSIVQNGTLPFNKFEFVVGWLMRECTGPYLFFNALWDPAIRWRERVFRLAWGGIAYEIPSSIKAHTYAPTNNHYCTKPSATTTNTINSNSNIDTNTSNCKFSNQIINHNIGGTGMGTIVVNASASSDLLVTNATEDATENGGGDDDDDDEADTIINDNSFSCSIINATKSLISPTSKNFIKSSDGNDIDHELSTLQHICISVNS